MEFRDEFLIKLDSKYGFKLFKLVEDYYLKDLDLTKEYFKEVESFSRKPKIY